MSGISEAFLEVVNKILEAGGMFYLEMSNSVGFKDADAWELTQAMVIKVFGDLRDARAIAQDTRGASGFVWAALQAHVVMARFIKFDFKRDPGLNAVLVQYILKKKQTDATSILGGVNVKSLESTVKRLEAEVAKLKAAKG
jgi:hypothetical protein